MEILARVTVEYVLMSQFEHIDRGPKPPQRQICGIRLPQPIPALETKEEAYLQKHHR